MESDRSTSASFASVAVVPGSLSTSPTSLTSRASSSRLDPLDAADLDPKLPQELVYSLVMKWRGKPYELSVAQSDTVGDLKQILWSLTGVPPDRQKLAGLVRGKLPQDEEEVVKLGLGTVPTGKPKEFMLIGTPEGEEHKSIGPSTTTDEPDIDYTASEAFKKAQQAIESVRNRRKLKEYADAFECDQMNPPRPGKKLLVLDLDGCILDTSLWKEPNFSTQMFMRPYLHDFLRLISPYYDIIIWSQTSWRWLEQKLVELDVIGPSKRGDYPVITTIDRTPMFSVYSERKGKPFKHEVKALGIIWSKFPEYYNAKNTVHLDDLSRNFAMNPKNGIKVHAYRDALTADNVSSDIELLYAARYLLQLVNVPDVTTLDHSRFRKAKLALPEGTEDPLLLRTGQPARDGPGDSNEREQ
ncbi:hypothetical protein JCM10212_003375 [Sporobolomyces blumeae]